MIWESASETIPTSGLFVRTSAMSLLPWLLTATGTVKEKKFLPREIERPGSSEMLYPGNRQPSLPPIKSCDGTLSIRAPESGRKAFRGPNGLTDTNLSKILVRHRIDGIDAIPVKLEWVPTFLEDSRVY